MKIKKFVRNIFILLTSISSLSLTSFANAVELKVGVLNLSATFAPAQSHSNVDSQFFVNMMEPLIGKNAKNMDNEFGPMFGGLAESYEIHPSKQIIDFKIRKGVKFHNGDDMTIEDVLFSLQSMINVTDPIRTERSKEFFGNIARAEALDENTVRVITKKPDFLTELFLSSQQSMIYPKKYLMSLTGDPDIDEISDYRAFGLAPVGTGPYKVTSFNPRVEIVYERHDDYWGEKAPYDKITMVRIPEAAARVTALINGEIDLATNIAPDQLATIDNSPGYKTTGAVTPLFHVIYFGGAGYDRESDALSGGSKTFTKELRQAMVSAVDRDLLNDALWFGKSVVPSTHSYPNYGKFYTPDFDTFSYDIEKAKKLIKDNNLEGTKIEFWTDPYYYTNGLLAAQAMAEMWKEIGIDVTIRTTETWASKGEPGSWGYNGQMQNWSNPMYYADPHGSFGKMWAPGGAGMTRELWNPSIGMEAYTELYNEFRWELDPEIRNAKYGEIMDLVKEDAFMLVLYQPFESYGMREDLHWDPFPGHIPYVLDFRAGMFEDDRLN